MSKDNSQIDEAAVAHEVDDMLHAWRTRVLHILLVIIVIVMLPVLLAVLTGTPIVLSWPIRIVALVVYVMALVAAMRPRSDLYWRAAALFLGIAVSGVIQLLVTRLYGSGRIALLLLPLLALLLTGARAGWLAAAFSTLLMVTFPLLVHSPLLAAYPVVGSDVAYPFWILQTGIWLGALIPLMILFTRFQVLQRRTMVAERCALRTLEREKIDRLKLEEEVARVGEDERRRLGAELHDGLCQHLTAMLLNCTALENRQKQTGVPDPAALEQLRLAITESIGMAYEVARGVSPVDMEPDSLGPALERLCRDVSSRHGVACRLQAQHDVTIRNPEHALHLYRIAGEAVNNAVRHGRCTTIRIALSREAGGILLEVVDDGRVVPGEPSQGAGLGLRIMAYRAGLIGGTLDMAAGEQGGVRVSCRVPDSEGAG